MKVIVAVEDKVYADAIVDFVTHNCWSKDTRFKVVHVQEDEPIDVHPEFCCTRSRDIAQEKVRRSNSLLLDVASKVQLALPENKVDEVLIHGRPRTEIVRLAEEWAADLIIVGSHGKTAVDRFLLGSVSLGVLSESPCSVMIVRLPKEVKHKHAGKSKERNVQVPDAVAATR